MDLGQAYLRGDEAWEEWCIFRVRVWRTLVSIEYWPRESRAGFYSEDVRFRNRHSEWVAVECLW